jgi:hypothetical protein
MRTQIKSHLNMQKKKGKVGINPTIKSTFLLSHETIGHYNECGIKLKKFIVSCVIGECTKVLPDFLVSLFSTLH